MKNLRVGGRWIGQVLPWLSPLVLLAYYVMTSVPYSYHPSDYHFILAHSWRIFGDGQAPYRDFIYLRPPFSLYLHSLWFLFPDGFVIQASRVGFYVQMILTGFVPLWVGIRYLGFPRLAGSVLTVMATALAIHNFPPMPWHTVDGVFFAVLGVSFFVVSRCGIQPLFWRALASLALALSALAKQNFALPAAVYTGVVILEFLTSNRGVHERRTLLVSFLPAGGLAELPVRSPSSQWHRTQG